MVGNVRKFLHDGLAVGKSRQSERQTSFTQKIGEQKDNIIDIIKLFPVQRASIYGTSNNGPCDIDQATSLNLLVEWSKDADMSDHSGLKESLENSEEISITFNSILSINTSHYAKHKFEIDEFKHSLF